jgi:hypothetical protein
MSLISRSIVTRSLITRGLLEKPRICYAIDFNGTNQYGVLAERAINVDGDIRLKFRTPSSPLNVRRMIITQTNNNVLSTSEFRLFTESGSLFVVIGGVQTMLLDFAQSTRPLAATYYELSIIGNDFNISRVGSVRSGALVRGAAREPTAPTRVGVRAWGDGTGFLDYFAGPQYDIVINDKTWVMGNKDNVIQPSIPAGNNMTLVNVTADRWIEAPCRIPPQPPIPPESIFLDDDGYLFDLSELFVDAELWSVPLPPESIFLDNDGKLFDTSELFTDAELWSVQSQPTILLLDTVLELDTALIGDN